jgi:uncharacterized membrane protein
MTYMIMYNTLIAVAAGVGLLGVAWLLRKLQQKETVVADGWALLFGINGFILTILGLFVCVTWPYNVKGALDANILFGEPALAFGVLLLGAAFYLWRERGTLRLEKMLAVLKPVSLYVFAIGLVMTACAISWARYRLGAAPPFEPISGRFSDYPVLESTFLAALYGLVALGALLFPLAVSKQGKKVWKTIQYCWLAAGVIFLGFGALNYYTHIGMIQNSTTGTDYKY